MVCTSPMSAADLFDSAWQDELKKGPPAKLGTSIQKLDYSELTAAIDSRDKKFIREFVRSFYSGEIYVFANAFNADDLAKLKLDAANWASTKVSEEPRITSRVPDYVSRRDWHAEDHGPGYSSTYEMMHFFRWNDDPINVFKLFEPKYRVLRAISGYDPDDIKSNGPEDGVIDRAELSHYPTGVGGIAFHNDPVQATRFLFTLNLNQFGVDYTRGGFAIGTGKGEVLAVDPHLEVGSLTGFLPSVCHGVEIIDPHLPANWENTAGRWYAAVSMVTTHLVKDRSVTVPAPGYMTLREQISAARNLQS